jgi:hypothetical protein
MVSAMVKMNVVNGGGLQFLPAEKCAILRVFTGKSRLQKIR